MPLNFTLVKTNPNDTTGGGGTLAAPMHDADAVGPFFVWPNQEFESGASPYAVVAASEVRAMYDRLLDEPMAGGEADTQPAEPVPNHTTIGHPYVSPEFEVEDKQTAESYIEAFHRDR